MIMATTIEQAIRPLILTSSVLGLGDCFSKKPHLSVLYNLTVWIIYGCLVYYIVTTLKVEAWFKSYYAILDMQIGILTSIISLIVNIYLHKKFRMFIKRLFVVDNTLEELGIPKIYRKLHIYAKGLLIGWLICCNLGNIFDMIWWFYAKKDHRYLLIPCIANHYYHVNLFVDLLFVICLWYIGTRFDKVNEYLKCLLIKEEQKYEWRKAIPIVYQNMICTDNQYILWTLMHLHLELCQIARQLNAMFGIQITMEMGAYIILLIRLCNYIFIHIKTEGRFIIGFIGFNWLNLYYWLFLHIIKIFFLNYICETVSTKSNKIEKIVHRLTDLHQYIDTREEINQFILQIIHHPLRFTGLGLFYLGNSFLRKFIMTVTTFIVIIMQMSTIPKVYNGF